MLITLYKKKLQAYLLLISCIIILLAGQTGCSIYRMEIKQGTKLTEEQLGQLKAKLTKEKVKELLGTPAIEPIKINRLDYFYSINDYQKKINQKQHLILFFDKKNQLTHYDGDFKINNLSKATKSNKK